MKFRIGEKILAGLMALTGLLLISGLVTIFYTHRLHRVNAELLDKSIASLKAAQELEVTLFRMKGLMFNYVIDGNPSWLEAFAAEKLEFQRWLSKAKKSAAAREESEVLA